jgi:hypothetical protein
MRGTDHTRTGRRIGIIMVNLELHGVETDITIPGKGLLIKGLSNFPQR